MPPHRYTNDPRKHISVRYNARDYAALDLLYGLYGQSSWRTMLTAIANDELRPVRVDPHGPMPMPPVGEITDGMELRESQHRALMQGCASLGAVGRDGKPSISALLHHIAAGAVKLVDSSEIFPDPVFQRAG